MSEDLSVLLSGSAAPSAQLKSLLEKQGIFGDPVNQNEFPNMLRLADPALVIHFGKEGAHDTVRVLQKMPPDQRVHLVVIASRSDLPELRKLDRNVVSSLLATDMPDSVLSARIAMLARTKRERQARGEALPNSPPVVPPMQAPAPKIQEVTLTEPPSPASAVSNRVTVSAPEPERPPPPSVPLPPAPITRKAELPSPPRVIVADSDVMRGDAIARNLRQNGILTLLVPLDPAKTRWPLVRQFSPSLLVVDHAALKGEGQIWHQLLLADQGLSSIRLAAVAFERVFDETTGAVDLTRLALHLPELSRAPHREPLATLVDLSAEVGDLDPALIEEVAEGERPTLFNSVARSPATESPTLKPAEVKVTHPSVAPIAKPYHPSFESIAPPNRTPRLALVAVVVLVLSAAGALVFKTIESNRREQAAAKQARAAALVPKEVVLESPTKSGDEKDISPWVVPSNSKVKSCEELIPHLDALKKLGADQANVSWANARKALVLGNLDEAHQYLCEASLLHPDGLAVEGLVELLLSKHAVSRAQTWMNQALKARPERRKTLDLQGDVLSQLGQVEEAKATWAKALKVDLNDEKSLASFGTHYDQEGENFIRNENWAKSELMFRRAATLNPKSASAAAHLAHTFLKQGYFEHAELWADTALQLQPDFGPALVVKADLAFEKQDQEAALTLYKQALKTDPGNGRAHQQVHNLTKKK